MSNKQLNKVYVIGVGMTKFEKPGGRDWDYPDMGKEAATKALADAGIPYDAVEQACVGYVYGDSTAAQRAVYGVGITGIPIYNVNNNCSTGSSALFMARQFIQGGLSECVLALGFEKMERGSLGSKWNDRTNPLDQHLSVMGETHGFSKAPFAPQMFGNAGREHMKKYGTTLEHFAKIAEKNHRHSANNPYSQFRDVYTLEQIMKSPMVHEPLTKLQCCPTSDGAACAILASESFVHKYGLQNRAIEVAGMAMATDLQSSFNESSMIKTVGFDMTQKAASEALRQAGLTPNDVQVVELHDCFSANELLTYEALGLCPIGGAGKFIDAGDNTYGGKYVVNPSGGLISKGHPLGATGLAQCAELVWQLRGEADKRQVKNAKAALQHNLGLGGAAVVAVYRKPSFAGVKPQLIPNKSRAESLGAAPKESGSASSAAPASSSSSSSSSKPSGFAAEKVFADLTKQASPDLVAKVKAIFRFDITKGSEKRSWLLDLKNGSGSLQDADESTKADCVIGISDENFVKLMSGKLNPQQAFMKGEIKLKGNMMLAQKLQLLQPKSKL
jgi:sterol carrier protein 2